MLESFLVISILFSSTQSSDSFDVKLIDINDPLVIYEGEQWAPEGYKIVEHARDCSDTIDCSHVTKHDCVARPKHYLVQCRQTCKSLYQGDKHLPEIFNISGGLEDTFIDPFGFKLNICAEQEGFDDEQRTTFVGFNYNMDVTIPYIPQFTKAAFEKVKIPEELYKYLMDRVESEDKPQNWINETGTAAGVINNRVVVQHHETGEKKSVMIGRTRMLALDMESAEKMFVTLGPLAEEWSGVKLRPTSLYGVRRYLNNSALISHTDKSNTHVISLILNMRQDVVKDWPLFIKDHQGNDHKIILKPGEMVWYESASRIHGRQQPLNGRFYDNIFVHFAPRGKGTWYDEEVHLTENVMPISLELIKSRQQNLFKPLTDWTEFDYSMILQNR